MEKAISRKLFDMRFVTAVSIVVGTSIGAGMLGLPVETARAGFFPSICLFLLTWFITIATGILFAEVLLKNRPGSNYISLSKNLLGKGFTFLIFGFYILLFYSLINAYTKGIGVILANDFGLTPSAWSGSLLFMIAFLPLMYFGTHLLARVNNFLSFVLIASFVLLIVLGNQTISFDFFKHQNWSCSLFSLPLIISSFGFHGTLPSLVEYLERDKKKIWLAIIIGSTITLCIYLSWEFLVLGSIPLEELLSALKNDQTAITPLSNHAKHPMIWTLAHTFSLSAIITSFIGVSIGLVDFLMDAFQLKKGVKTKILLLASIYLSALLLSATSLRVFYLSLNYGAGFAGIFLLIFLPAFFVRQLHKKEGITFRKRGLLTLVFVFSAVAAISCLLSLF